MLNWLASSWVLQWMSSLSRLYELKLHFEYVLKLLLQRVIKWSRNTPH
jgi:hypothetical protein